MAAARFTPTERRLLRVLRDGLPHHRRELFACLPDDLGSQTNVQIHISRMRKKLESSGRWIAFERRGGSPHYRLVRLIVSFR